MIFTYLTGKGTHPGAGPALPYQPRQRGAATQWRSERSVPHL
jgi:hypothetical protein